MSPKTYLLFADGVLVLHVLFVLFVILGLLAILIGGGLKWGWVKNLKFRIAHLIGIGVVVGQAWVGVICPLTILESWLRNQAGVEGYQGSFIQHWLQKLLYYDAPAWVFILAYSGFGLLVLLSWFWVRPERKQPRLDNEKVN